MYQNNRRRDLLEHLHSGNKEIELARRVENELFDQKNRYRLEELKLNYADSKRMAIDSKKLTQVLNHHDQIREKFDTDVGTYNKFKNTNLENRLASAWAETAYGGMRALRDEIGLKNRHSELPFLKASDVEKIRDETFSAHPDTEVTLQYLMNALFTPIDMTEYEEVFSGGYYSSSRIPHTDADSLNLLHGNMNVYAEEAKQISYAESVPLPNNGHNRKADERRQELKEARAALLEKLEELNASDDEEEEDGDEDEEEGEEEEGAAPKFGDDAPKRYHDWNADKHVGDEEWPPKPRDKDTPRSEFFKRHETLKTKYNDVEIDAFLKLLNVKPLSNW